MGLLRDFQSYLTTILFTSFIKLETLISVNIVLIEADYTME